MKNLLIVQAESRLGMKYFPHGDTKLNLGVEYGPKAVLSNAFLGEIQETCGIDLITYAFSDPEEVNKEEYYKKIADESDALAKEIVGKLDSKKYAGLITVGGDHGIAFASVLGTLRFLRDKKVGVIDFDSHGDIHLQKTSPSGNFHGMWLRPFFGDFDDPAIREVTDVFIAPSQFLYVGNLLLEEEEERFIQEKGIQQITLEDIQNRKDASIQRIVNLCANVDVVHVTFDIDVFKKSIVSATGTPNPAGFGKDAVLACIEPIVNSGKLFSLDLVEVNPDKDNAQSTVETAQMVIEQFVSGFKG